MKRVCVLVVLAVALLIPACSSQAADLQAGWYANALGIDFYQTVGPYDMVVASAEFSTPAGDYGPFHVSAPDARARLVSVPAAAQGISHNASLILPTSISIMAGYSLSNVSYYAVYWSTNYDTSQMRLELWRNPPDAPHPGPEWYQGRSGVQQGYITLAGGDLSNATFTFRVAVVPEPAGAFWLPGVLMLNAAIRRRRSKL